MSHPAFRLVVVAASLLVCSPLVRAQNGPGPSAEAEDSWSSQMESISSSDFCSILDS